MATNRGRAFWSFGALALMLAVAVTGWVIAAKRMPDVGTVTYSQVSGSRWMLCVRDGGTESCLTGDLSWSQCQVGERYPECLGYRPR